jgi:hypothetical protein
MKTKIVCIKQFTHVSVNFLPENKYTYYTNFGGLNHIVVDYNDHVYPFTDNKEDKRPFIWDYFVTLDDWRR